MKRLLLGAGVLGVLYLAVQWTADRLFMPPFQRKGF
jgi:hypothetical protein